MDVPNAFYDALVAKNKYRRSIDVLLAVRDLLSDYNRWSSCSLAQDAYGNDVLNWHEYAAKWSLFGAVVRESHGCESGIRDGVLSTLNDLRTDAFEHNTLTHGEVVNLIDAALDKYRQWQARRTKS